MDAIRDVISECKGKERMIESQAGLISLYIFIQGSEGGRVPFASQAKRMQGAETERSRSIPAQAFRKNRNRFVPLIRARSHKIAPTSIESACLRRGKGNEKDSRPPQEIIPLLIHSFIELEPPRINCSVLYDMGKREKKYIYIFSGRGQM